MILARALLGAVGLRLQSRDLGLLPATGFSPFAVALGQRHSQYTCASTCSLALLRSCRINRRSVRSSLRVELDFSGPMIRFVAGRTHVAPVARSAFLSPDASHEVFVPSAFTGRVALCGAAGPGRSRFGVVRFLAYRASTILRSGVALAVFRSANVVRSGLMWELGCGCAAAVGVVRFADTPRGRGG